MAAVRESVRADRRRSRAGTIDRDAPLRRGSGSAKRSGSRLAVWRAFKSPAPPAYIFWQLILQALLGPQPLKQLSSAKQSGLTLHWLYSTPPSSGPVWQAVSCAEKG